MCKRTERGKQCHNCRVLLLFLKECQKFLRGAVADGSASVSHRIVKRVKWRSVAISIAPYFIPLRVDRACTTDGLDWLLISYRPGDRIRPDLPLNQNAASPIPTDATSPITARRSPIGSNQINWRQEQEQRGTIPLAVHCAHRLKHRRGPMQPQRLSWQPRFASVPKSR